MVVELKVMFEFFGGFDWIGENVVRFFLFKSLGKIFIVFFLLCLLIKMLDIIL